MAVQMLSHASSSLRSWSRLNSGAFTSSSPCGQVWVRQPASAVDQDLADMDRVVQRCPPVVLVDEQPGPDAGPEADPFVQDQVLHRLVARPIAEGVQFLLVVLAQFEQGLDSVDVR